jgi:hypothetical protein
VPQNPNTASDSAELVVLESRYGLLDGVIEEKKPPRAGRDATKVGSGVDRATVTEGIDLGRLVDRVDRVHLGVSPLYSSSESAFRERDGGARQEKSAFIAGATP